MYRITEVCFIWNWIWFEWKAGESSLDVHSNYILEGSKDTWIEISMVE